ncbi:hypothetical protein ACRAWF_21920 [Streptomyces sp. L7]
MVLGDPARVDTVSAIRWRGFLPVAVGCESLTLTVQEPFAAIEDPQVLVWE